MEIKEYITESYPTTSPFSGINAIQELLLDKEYLVVIDEKNKYEGILTPSDLIKNPYKIVIDCLTEKGKISSNEKIISILDKFNKCNCPILPVFDGDDFIGIIKKEKLIDGLKIKINQFYDQSLISEKIKYTFLTNLSHEIRTPLNGILGFLEILSELDIEDPTIDKKEFNKIIKSCTDRFLLVMDDLVDLSLFHTGSPPSVKTEKVYIDDLFNDLKKYFNSKEIVSDKEITIQYQNLNNVDFIISDRKKIKHILYHLIDNAIKFSNKACIVKFGCNLVEDNIIFHVENQGFKIPKDKSERIFEAFEKQDNFNNDLIEGLGIGLTLVTKLSELLNGKISFTSDDNQTTFSCIIPAQTN